MKRNERPDLLVFKADSFDTDLFFKEVFSYSKNSIVYCFDFTQAFLVHKPECVGKIPSAFKYIIIQRKQFGYWFLAPFTGLLNVFGFIILSGYLCVRFRPKVCWTESTWVALAFAVMRKLGFCDRSVYCVGNWLDTSPKQGLTAYLANNIFWRALDYISASFSDLVLSPTKEIGEARDRFWGKKVAKRVCSTFPPPLLINGQVGKKAGSNICFLGQVRSDSGLELLLPLLPVLNQKYGIKLKIAGPIISYRTEIERQIKSLRVEQFVELYGWVDTKDVGTLMADCFCGVNLITSKDGYSSYTTPGKLFHYLQSLLPVLVTEGNGPFTQFVRQDNLGLVIEPEKDQIIGAIGDLFERQTEFRENIKQYIDKYSFAKKVKDYIEIASGKCDP